MNVKIIKTGEVEKVNPSYGMRMIEQGKAVLAQDSQKKPVKKDVAKVGDA